MSETAREIVIMKQPNVHISPPASVLKCFHGFASCDRRVDDAFTNCWAPRGI